MSIIHFATTAATATLDVVGFTSDPYSSLGRQTEADASSTITFKTDGTIDKTEDGGLAEQIGTWYSQIDDASDYEITLTKDSGDDLSGTYLAPGTYVMSANRQFGIESSYPPEEILRFDGTVVVRKTGESDIDSASVTVRAESLNLAEGP